MSDVTQMLESFRRGEAHAPEELLPLVYDELRRVAASKMAQEGQQHTLQPTALVHEAWLRLVGGAPEPRFQNRAHFFGAAAEAMRRILIERARRRLAARHGGALVRMDLDEVDIAAPGDDEEAIAVSDALDRLASVDKQKAELVKLRYFVGMTLEEAASAMGVSEPTAKRWWAYARAWLFNEISPRQTMT